MEVNPKFISVDFKIGARGGNTKKNHILTLLSSTPQLYDIPTFIIVIIMLVVNIIIFTIPHNSSLFKDFTLTVNTNTTTKPIPTISTTNTTTT